MDEYISREATVKAFCEKCRGYYDGHCIHRGECDVDVIQTAPAADVQPVKQGKWVERKIARMKWIPNDDDNVNPDDVEPERMTEQKCSYCNRRTIKFTDHIELNYCPLCGAKMDGDSE